MRHPYGSPEWEAARERENAIIAQAIKDEGWTRRKEMVKGGEYDVSNVERTVTVSADGRFKIFPSGVMTTSKIHGGHGERVYRWSWTGFSMSDTERTKAYEAGEDMNFFNGPRSSNTVKGYKEAVAKWRLTGR